MLVPAGVANAAVPAGFTQTNLVSDVPGLAQITDPLVSNPWGLALGMAPTPTPLWINNENSATSEVYQGANGVDPLTRRLVVQTPANPTGIVFNNTGAFQIPQPGGPVPSLFLFNGLDGYTSAWGPALGVVNGMSTAVPTSFFRRRGYFGMAIANAPGGPRLYAADFVGTVDIFDGNFRRLTRPAAFVDPGLDSRLGPYGIAVFGSQVLVTYTSVSGQPFQGEADVIDVFDLTGRFVRRLATGGPLVAPWGMAMAPPDWGRFGGMLLVGNVGNGHINAFDPTTGAFKGTLRNAKGRVIVNSGLWGLTFGNGATGTPRTLLFAAGIDNYSHGLVGLIQPN
jgi:uncharacterized protein (TIGR03118 family)